MNFVRIYCTNTKRIVFNTSNISKGTLNEIVWICVYRIQFYVNYAVDRKCAIYYNLGEKSEAITHV